MLDEVREPLVPGRIVALPHLVGDDEREERLARVALNEEPQAIVESKFVRRR